MQLPLENGGRLPKRALQSPPAGMLGACPQPQLLNSPHQLPCKHSPCLKTALAKNQTIRFCSIWRGDEVEHLSHTEKGHTSPFFPLGFFSSHVEEAICEGPKLGLHPCPPPGCSCLPSCHLLPALPPLLSSSCLSSTKQSKQLRQTCVH